jgi:hypothetical protein
VSPKEKKKHYDANQVKCIDVPADGNCLFHSILAVEPKAAKDVAELRGKVADHLESNGDAYKEWVPNKDVAGCAAQIREDAHWNFDGMDVVPHVVADLLQRQVHIHTDEDLAKPLEVINEGKFKNKNKILLDLTDNHYRPIVPMKGKGKQHPK